MPIRFTPALQLVIGSSLVLGAEPKPIGVCGVNRISMIQLKRDLGVIAHCVILSADGFLMRRI
jgi:hypothetical protein